MYHPSSLKSYVFFPYRSNITNTKPSFGWGVCLNIFLTAKVTEVICKPQAKAAHLHMRTFIASGSGPELCDTCSCLQLNTHIRLSNVSAPHTDTPLAQQYCQLTALLPKIWMRREKRGEITTTWRFNTPEVQAQHLNNEIFSLSYMQN